MDTAQKFLVYSILRNSTIAQAFTSQKGVVCSIAPIRTQIAIFVDYENCALTNSLTNYDMQTMPPH